MNKQAELTRWTSKRLLSLLMALIMTLSLLPTAAFADDGEDSKTLKLSYFTPMAGRETWHNVSSGKISDSSSTTYELAVHIDPAVSYTPGMEVTVQAKANLNLATGATVDTSNQLKVYINGNTKYDESEADATQITYTYSPGSYDITVGQDGSITFKTKIEYSVNENGETITGSKLVNVRINDLWTGYTVTYDPDSSTLINVPDGNTDKTNKQEYTIPADATASKNGYTFEGWQVSGSGSSATGVVPSGTTIDGITGDITLKANLVANQPIEFDPVYSGVSGLPYLLKATSTGSTYQILFTPQLANYTFDGWSVTGGTGSTAKIDTADPNKVIDINAPITLTPKWVPANGSTPAGSHKVTFDGVYTGVSNIPAVQVVKDDEMTTEPKQTPLREGYVFKHWSTTQNGEAYAFGNVLTEDLTLYAVWEREKVNITWPTNLTSENGVESFATIPASVAKGGNISFSVKLKDGYEFRQGAVKVDGVPLGWTFDEATNTYHFTFKADTDAEDKTIAVTADNPTVKTFTISLPQGDGYAATFTGCTTVAGNPEGMTSFTFNYGDKFKIKLESDADVAATLRVNGAEVAKTDGKDKLTATTDEYTVNGNYLVSASAKRRVERTVIFTLLPEYGQYTQMFVDNGSKITAPTAPDIAGYNFGGKWYKDANCETEWDFNNDTVTSNTVLYGKLTAKTYTISYNENKPAGVTDAVAGMPTGTTQKKHGTAVSLDTATPTLTGYTFKGWATSANGPVAYAAGGQYLVDSDITLYAVWQINTFTVTVSSGAGYSTVPSGTYTVEYGQPFTVTINVDRQYAAVKPTVKDNGTPVGVTGNPNDIGAASYTYTIDSVTANHSIDITVTQNAVHTVSFTVSKLTSAPNATILTAEAEAAPFLTQSVEHGYYASMPAAPEREGFKFKGYYSDATGVTAFPFEQPITNNEEVFAVYEPILPVITITELNGTGWKTENWKHGTETMTNADTTNKSFTIAYGDNVTFDLVIAKGYDYSKLSVTANGLALGYQSATTDEKTGVTTLHYYLGSVMADTRIAITGIERKTITITYNANARDDVSGLPSPQVVKYYLEGSQNDTITAQEPKRTGYEFVGWCTDSEATVTVNGNTKTINTETGVVVYPGATAPFTTDTTLYAIWLAQDTTLTLKITDVALDKNDGKRVIQYEGESITLQAELNVNAKGTVVFYKGDKEGTNGTRIGSAAINGKTAELVVKVGEYKTTDKDEYYWAVFESETDEGYANSEKSNIMNVGVFSKAITWPLGTKNADTLTITEATGSMTAGKTYKLTVDITKILGLETVTPDNAPKLGEDYAIVWQYKNTVTGDWADMSAEITDTNEYQVTPEYAGHEYRAKIVPIGDLYTKAAKFDENGIVNNEYDKFLYTNTVGSVLQATATTLTIDAPEESKDIKINGAMPFTADHLAQFEGQAVTLTATVTDTTTGTPAVTTGFVDFYRKGATVATKLNASPIAVGANGVATCEVEISKWTGGNVTDNKDEFYAVYLANATYDTSDSKTTPQTVYIKSTAIKTPIIDSTLAGTLNGTVANSTSYEHDLTDLLAGVQHTFKLRQDADQTAKDYSVVALDGRTVAAKNYDIEWQYKTNGNFAKVDNDSTAVTYTTKTTKFGDQYRVVLNAKGDMTVGATSKVAEIGTKQDVTVTVKALDAIESTAATDVYQLNEITLTATVAAANDKPTMQPTGTVTFYYQDEADHNKWIELGTSTLTKNAQSTQGEMVATLQTAKLPVAKTTYTSLTSKITAVYSGDDTFQQNQTFTKGAASTENLVFGEIAKVGGNTTNDVEVTVRSSVVKGCADANKAVTTLSDTGIHISADGLAAHEGLVTLKLDEVYTLDAKEAYSKLLAGTDYTVQWQILSGASAHNNGGDYSSADAWVNIDGATGTTYTLTTVEQDAAYRAVITVANEPITKGSFTEIEQDANALLNGHKQYYSNVLCAADGQTTIDVLIDTNGRGTNKEGITEGETVNVNVFLSGATQATPIADVTVKIENDTAKGNNETYSTTLTGSTVNGWNVFPWNTVGVAPGFYKVTVSSKSNTGYADETVTRSLIVRESSYTIAPSNTTVTYNGRTQGLTVALNGFGFNGTGINEAANKSWTVKYYDKGNNLVEPTQAGTYKAVVTLPASAYWTEQTKTVDFTIKQRSVSIADAIAQAKVYDGTTNVSIVEVMLNDAVTDQTTNGTGLPTNNVGIINGDSIYAVATEAKLSSANAGDNSFTISTIALRGDDAANYVWDGTAAYTEDIYVSRSQVYGVSSTDVTLKAGEKLPADAVYMIDQAGNKITTYDVLYYLHTDTEIKKVDNTNEKGLYTVIVRPKQDNYKSGVTLRVTVGDATNYTAAVAPKPSTLIAISNTAELYGAATGVTASTTNSTATTTIEYQGVSTGWTATAPTNAGRYLVKVTASTGDVAYGIYTITKAHPSIDVTPATGLTYNSMPQNGYTTLTGVEGKDASKDYYITYAGDVAIGYNTPADGNVDEQAPVDAGEYAVTLHVNETANYTAHEISKSFTIAKKALTIKAKHVGAWQYGSMPGFYASYEGLAGDVNDSTPDTSLRDVQIAPELLFNPTSNNQSNYSNDALDQVGKIIIRPVDALSKNYEQTPVDGEFTKNEEDPKPTLTILGLPQNGKSADVTVYYGDEIQLSAYGNYLARRNTSSFLKWEITNSTLTNGSVSIDENNILHVNGVGEFTVTLKRGVGEQQIKTEINVTAIKKEAKIALKNVDKVYTGASQTYDYTGNVTVHDELYQPIDKFVDSKLTRTNTARTNVGTQITTAQVTGALAYQSEIYGGKFTINDKEASVAPGEQSTVYGTPETFDTNPKYTVTNEVNSVAAVSGVNVASQTDAYNRLDVHDGYEILVAGAENMNYNVKYTTDETAEDSAVTTYDGMKLYSTTTKAKNELNDTTVYGEQANDLDWILDAVKSTTRDSVDYADNLADFDLTDTTGIFIKQDKDDCVGNAKTYKAANREEGNTSNTALAADRTATEKAADDNYELVFSSVTNARAKNYRLDNNDVKNEKSTMTAPTGTVGFIGAATTSDNLIEGSANIAQRPIKLEKAVTDAQLYWRLPQSQLYTALVNILKAEENSVGRGLAKGHTIEDLDLSFTIKVGSTTYNVAKDGTDAINFAATGNATVTATVGDTNYKLEGGQYQFDIVLKNIQIEATYTTKTFTGFTVLIKVHNEGGAITPLNDAKGLSYKIFKKTGDTIDKTTAYASGTLTYQNRTAYDDKGVLCGVFTATYPQLPLLNSGETYFIQMYEYGVELKTNS